MKYGYTIVFVSSVSDSLDFYKEAFGFKTRFLDDSKQYGELDTGTTVLAFASHLMGKMNFGDKFQKPTNNSTSFNFALAFIVDNVALAYANAIVAGATPIGEPLIKPWGQTVAYVRANEGELIELCSPMSG